MLGAIVRDIADVSIIDGYSHALSVREISEQVIALTPDLVGISMPFAFSQRPAVEIAGLVKSELPGALMVAGGNQATFRADDILRNSDFDFIVLCEGETVFRALVERFSGDGIESVKADPPDGIRYRKNSDYLGEPVVLIADLDKLPFPAPDLLPGWPDFYTARIITSRGCPFNCPYCSSTAFWRHTYRGRSPGSVVGELRNLNEKWGIKRVSFADDTFNIDRERCLGIAGELIKSQIGIEWGASMRPDLVSREALDVYRRAGLTGLFFGMESGSLRILKSINRTHDLEISRELIRHAEEIGIEVHCSFMIGLPEEKAEDVEMTIEYARSLNASTLGFHIFHPLPGSVYGENPEGFGVEWENPELAMEGLGAIDGVAPVRTLYLTSMQIVDYYFMARGLAEERMRNLKNP